MTNFVECLTLWNNKITSSVLGAFLKEWFHLPSRVHEIVSPPLMFSFEVLNLLSFQIEIFNNICHFVLHHLDGISVVNLMEYGVSVLPEILYSFRIYLLSQIFVVDR